MSQERHQPQTHRWIFELVVFGSMGTILFFMVAGLEIGIYLAGACAAGVSATLGWVSVQREWVTLVDGVRRFGMACLWVVGFAAFSVLNGRWEPAVFFGVLSVTLTGLYAIGARLGLRAMQQRTTS